MSTEIDFKMTEDSGIPPVKPREKVRKKARSARIQAYIDQFARFKVGQSFFVPGVKRKNLEFLRQPFVDAGLACLMREVERDEIYGVAGVRVWRQHGQYDECVGDEAPPYEPAPDYDPDLDAPTSQPQPDPGEDDEL